MLTSPKNVLLSNVTLNWARLDTPADNPFGGIPSYEVQAVFQNAEAANVAREAGINVKEKDGVTFASLRRKSQTKDGSPMDPVRVVDASKQPMDSTARRKIGNGSKGNIIVWCAPYEYAGRKGVTASSDSSSSNRPCRIYRRWRHCRFRYGRSTCRRCSRSSRLVLISPSVLSMT